MGTLRHLQINEKLQELLAEHPWARDIAEQLAYYEQQLGQEAMALILEFFQAELAAAEGDPYPLREVVAKIEAFERSRGRL